MYLIDRRVAANFDWPLLILTALLSAAGLANLYSATHNVTGAAATPIYVKQIYWHIIALAVFLIVTVIDYRFFERYAYLAYGCVIGLLIATLLFGRTISGAQRWIHIGSFSLQSSELAKIALILALAKFFHNDRPRGPYRLRDLAIPFGLLALPFALVVQQPDLGTAMLMMFIFFSMILFVRIRTTSLLALIFTAIASLPVLWANLKDYQKRRVLDFLRPEQDPLGSGYHIIQSKIAVGSGHFLGKGFLDGTQSQLHFLPEQHTDFIFSVLAEEWGFLGSAAVLFLFFLLILKAFKVARSSKDLFGSLCAFGVGAMLFWHVTINIGMVSGVVPVVGVPLPFLSYGGSFLLAVMAGVGLLMNIQMRRYFF